MNPQRSIQTDEIRSAFQATRLTPSTFLVKEFNDIYSEHPHIYVKVVPSEDMILVIDTGCGGESNDPDIQIKSLREFIETVPLDDNDNKPLNGDGKMRYTVVATHCHYDHILGVEQFNDSLILASSHSPSFISTTVLPEHSLCNAMGIKTPSFKPTLVSHLFIIPSGSGVSVLHTPGHTPDELALYDAGEKMLYVGDSLYEEELIIFPNEGSLVAWFISIDAMISLVKSENQCRDVEGQGEVLINAGHCTVARPALEVLEAAKAFVTSIVAGKEPIRKGTVVRGEETLFYEQEGGRFSVRCPERLVLEMGESGKVGKTS